MSAIHNACVLEAEPVCKVVDAVEERVDRLIPAHSEDNLVLVHKRFELDNYVVHVGNLVPTVCILAKLVLTAMLKVEYP